MTVGEEGLRTLVELGRALRARRLDLDPVVHLGRAVLAEEERPLRWFVERVVAQPARLRDRWLEETARHRAALDPTLARALDLLGMDPDLLGPTASRYDEVAHTRTVAWALEHPSLAADTRAAFLRLLERGRAHHGAAPFDRGAVSSRGMCCSAEVVVDGAGRVDVVLESESDVILVEAKLLAGEGYLQTQRYARARGADPRQWTVVFLTLDPGHRPSGPAIHLTFAELLAAWLPVAAAGGTDAHRHLGAYLATVARILGAGRAGTFDQWDFYQRRRAIELVKGGVG